VLDLGQREDHPTLVQTMVVNGRVMPLAISPDRRYLYAALRSAPHAVWCGAIDPVHGTLRPVQTGPLVDSMAYLSIDRSGRYLFAASYGGSKISVNAIRPDSVVDPVPLAVVPTRKNAHAIAGVLTLLASQTVMPDGFRGIPWAADIHLTPNGRLLYTSERTSSTLAAFRFEGDSGALTPIDHCETEPQPREFAIDPEGTRLLAVGEMTGGLTTYEIDQSTGALRPMSRLNVGEGRPRPDPRPA
jgi:6-phosphogluconolactonase